MVFASQLVIARKNKHLSQEKLAEHLDVTRQAVAKWENGESVPDIHKLIQIADFFNMSIDALVQGNDCVESEMVVAKRIYPLICRCNGKLPYMAHAITNYRLKIFA